MTLTVESLRDQGAFTGPPVKREITWTVGEQEYKGDVYVRRLSYHSAVTDVQSLNGGGDIGAARIAHCIVDEAGKPIFTLADVTGVNADGSPVLDEDGNERGALCSELSLALLVAISEVNQLGKTDAPS